MLNQRFAKMGLRACGRRVVEITRELMEKTAFLNRHRRRQKDFTRNRLLPFNRVVVLLLQKSVRSLQAHLHEFFDRLDQDLKPVTASAWSQARQKLRHTAFIELNQKAIVEVVDNGPGILPEHRTRIFEPFFTTKPVGEGTGLGLDTVHRIVTAHRGEVTFQSQPGETRFLVRIPLARSKEPAA